MAGNYPKGLASGMAGDIRPHYGDVEKAVYGGNLATPVAPLTLGEVQMLADEAEVLARQVREIGEGVHTLLFAEPVPTETKGPTDDPGIGLHRLRFTLRDIVMTLGAARRVIEETHQRVSQ